MSEQRVRIVHELLWSDLSLVAWGGVRPGGIVTVHLPHELFPQPVSWAATINCMPGAGLAMTWSWRFGLLDWQGAILCRRCFDHKRFHPRPKKRPVQGWLTYAHEPPDEASWQTVLDAKRRRELVLNKLLATHLILPHDTDETDFAKRIVEV
jgi:hypothetical protein